MFKYGHMLTVGDMLYVGLKKPDGQIDKLVPVEVKDLWGPEDNRWAEFWTFGEGQIARPLVVRRITKFSHFHLFDGHDRTLFEGEPSLLIGTSMPYQAVQ